MDKLINLLTLQPLKGNRTKLSLLAGATAVGLEQFGVLMPGTLTQYKPLWMLAGSYFLLEHFEKK